jgi:hypothetical protein
VPARARIPHEPRRPAEPQLLNVFKYRPGASRHDAVIELDSIAISHAGNEMSPNDVRRFENQTPITGGDEYLRPIEMLRIREIPAVMPVYLPKRGRELLANDSLVVEGPLEEAVAKLTALLHDDYSENIIERESVPWDFDYVVTNDGLNSGAIDVYTRLFNPLDSTMGSGLYGRTVRRVSETIYRLWAQE